MQATAVVVVAVSSAEQPENLLRPVNAPICSFDFPCGRERDDHRDVHDLVTNVRLFEKKSLNFSTTPNYTLAEDTYIGAINLRNP